MNKRILTVIAIVLLFSLFIGCSNSIPKETTTALSNPKTTITTTSKPSTTAKPTTRKPTAASATSKTATSTTKKTTSAKTTALTTKKKQTHTQVDAFCYLTVECKSLLNKMDDLKEGHEDFVPKNGIIINKTKCTLKKGETVYDILERVCKNKSVKLTSRDTIYGVYVCGINNLDEFDCGSQSGWVYTVNEKSPTVSCGKYTVSFGDTIVFKYVC